MRASDGITSTDQTYTLKVLNLSGIESFGSNLVSGFYPNPASNKLYVDLKSITNIKIDIYNLNGQLITSINGVDKLITIDVSTWKNGLYILKVSNKNGTENFKFNVNK